MGGKFYNITVMIQKLSRGHNMGVDLLLSSLLPLTTTEISVLRAEHYMTIQFETYHYPEYYYHNDDIKVN